MEDDDNLRASTILSRKLQTAREQWQAHYGAQFNTFLREFNVETVEDERSDNRPTASHYELLALEAVQLGMKSLFIDLQDLRSWGSDGDDLTNFIQKYFLDLTSYLDGIVDNLVKDVVKKHSVDGTLEKDIEHYSALFYNASSIHSVRTLRCNVIGELITLRATVTRTSDIRPELRVAAFECDTCGNVVDKVEQQFKFTEPTVCPRKECGNRIAWNLKRSSCEFSDWQKLRVQENASEIPAGSMPRTIDVIVRNDTCDRAKAGDRVLITGSLLAIPDVPSLMKPGTVPKAVARDKQRKDNSEFGMLDNTIRGLKELGVRDLGYRLCFLGTHVKVINAVADDDGNLNAQSRQDEESGPFGALSERDREIFKSFAESSRCLDKLASYIAPEVYGHEEIKKGILLLLVSGVEKSTEKEAIKLRGDINGCIVGDPGTAKSQLLKFVQGFVGQAVYTSGKSSTAAGLTASVHRDMDQGDAIIEAGALMLADKGVCCIDEFDKMDEKDVVAIHEAMEQQTISIAKAGIQATLNARASVLAACNPANGRYDLSRTFRQNVRLSAPIMSRFDLLFVMIDDTDRDEVVARHMVKIHSTMCASMNSEDEFDRQKLREYIRIAKTFKPKITEEAKEVLKSAWITLRQQDSQARNVRITVRQLESLIRLSEAVAKLRFSNDVIPSHVEEAYQLYNNSLTKIKKDFIDFAEDDDALEEFDGDVDKTLLEDGTRKLIRRSDETDEDYERREKAHRDELIINGEEFERVAQLLVEYLRDRDRLQTMADPHDPPIITTRDNLVTWYLDTHFDTDSEEDLSREYRKIIRIVNRMANRDFTVIEERRPMQTHASDMVRVEDVLTIRLHPNYAERLSYCSSAGPRAHASLTTSYFTAVDRETSNANPSNAAALRLQEDVEDFDGGAGGSMMSENEFSELVSSQWDGCP